MTGTGEDPEEAQVEKERTPGILQDDTRHKEIETINQCQSLEGMQSQQSRITVAATGITIFSKMSMMKKMTPLKSDQDRNLWDLRGS